jgi:CHRD domain
MSLRIFGLATGAALVAAWTGQPATRSVTYVARMNGAQETPSTNAKGSGTATLTVDGTKLKYSVEIHDLSGPPTAAHIHVGAIGIAGPPVYTFVIKSGSGSGGTISEGTIDLTTDASAGVSGDSLKVLLSNGKAYVNVHSKNFPGGEIRGQVMAKQ